MMRHSILAALIVAVSFWVPGEAEASLTGFQTFVGNVGVSTDGFGSQTQSGNITANVPVGATVLGAYLYTSTFNNPTLTGASVVLAGTNVGAFTNLGVVPPPACCTLAAGRVDVTGIVAPIIDGGPGGTYNFSVVEGATTQDGEALVVVYELASLANSTVGILDGFSDVAGDTTLINFANPLDPTDAGFFAEMRLGIGFSCCGQESPISVNGTTITTAAGNFDDGVDPSGFNGQLITVGGWDDPFSTFLPSYANDHERYNLVPQISLGDTSIMVNTSNPSRDDNIFLAVFHVAGEAGINEPPPDPTPEPVPEPATFALLALGAGWLGVSRRRFRRS